VHLIFDLDGTLVDSLAGIASALNRALESKGLPTHPEAVVRTFIGKGSLELARQAIPSGSPDALAHELDAAFQRDYADHWRTGSELYPGIASLITTLHADGYPLAVLSNKPDLFTREIVEHFFPGAVFTEVMGKSDRFERKPAPDAALHLLETWAITPGEARFIGDSDIDRLTAENAEIPFIGVSWGYHPMTGLGERVATDVDGLDSLIRAGT